MNFKRYLYIILIALIPVSVLGQTKENNYLILNRTSEFDYFYQSNNGEIVVPAGKYAMLFTDTIVSIGFVADFHGKILAITKTDSVLFEVFNFDNGNDPVREGLFRILKNGKIGYANLLGVVVIEPQFDCAYPFENGKAKVAKNCKYIRKGEITLWKSNDWFYIDKWGNIIK